MAYLAIDAGSHAVRAAVFIEGVMTEVMSEAIALDKTAQGYIEQNPSAMAAALKRVCLRAIASVQGGSMQGRSMIAALAVQRSSVLMWDRHSSQPLSSVLSWQDTRGALQVASFDAATKAQILALTGLHASAHYGATKLAWLRRQASEVDDPSLVMGPLACWLASQLTGTKTQYRCDHVNAARTQLLNRHTLKWDAQLCSLFGVEAAQLPVPVASVADYGQLALGNRAIIPLVAVLGDQNAAYIALRFGAAADGFKTPLVVNIGSGAFVLGELPGANVNDDARLLTSLAFSRDNQALWLREGTVNAAGTTITRWLAQLAGQLSEADLFEQLPLWLDDRSHEGIVCVDTDVGLGSPFWQPYAMAQGVIFFDAQGKACKPSLAAQAVAVIESIVFLIAANIVRLQASGVAYDGLIVAGGLARVTGLVERLAQLIQLPYRVASCHEATLQGAAVMASGFTQVPTDNGNLYPPKQQSQSLQRRFERYIQCVQSLVV